MANKSTIIEVEADIVFSNLYEPRESKTPGKRPLYTCTLRIPKDDPQIKTIASAAKQVLGLDKLTAQQLGVTDGDTELSSRGEPVAPGCYQLWVGAGYTQPTFLDKTGNKMALEFEPGRDSRILAALKVTQYNRKSNDFGSPTIPTASYFLVKAVALDVHPYEGGALTNEDKQYEFTRFRAQEPAQPATRAPEAGASQEDPDEEELGF